jgi:hypothetical protein
VLADGSRHGQHKPTGDRVASGAAQIRLEERSPRLDGPGRFQSDGYEAAGG